MEEYRMGWENVVLADTKIEKPPAIPVGTYVFTLQPGASYKERTFTKADGTSTTVKELNVRFDITDGEHAGRPVWVSYPDPTAIDSKGKPMTWSAQAVKKLEISLGQDALPGEDTVVYLNRVALNGNARITAPLLPGKNYIN